MKIQTIEVSVGLSEKVNHDQFLGRKTFESTDVWASYKASVDVSEGLEENKIEKLRETLWLLARQNIEEQKEQVIRELKARHPYGPKKIEKVGEVKAITLDQIPF